jgi:hypothetical protein
VRATLLLKSPIFRGLDPPRRFFWLDITTFYYHRFRVEHGWSRRSGWFRVLRTADEVCRSRQRETRIYFRKSLNASCRSAQSSRMVSSPSWIAGLLNAWGLIVVGTPNDSMLAFRNSSSKSGLADNRSLLLLQACCLSFFDSSSYPSSKLFKVGLLVLRGESAVEHGLEFLRVSVSRPDVQLASAPK